MYMVVFRTKNKPEAASDPDYEARGSRMWDGGESEQRASAESHCLTPALQLAMGEYGCVDASGVAKDDGTEIFVSYWNSLDDIKRWRHDKEHDDTISKAKDKWLEWYSIEVCEVQRA